MARRRKNPNQKALDVRIQDFLQDFAREAPYVREHLAKDIPAYNRLLSMEALSFKEFALQQVAAERGETYEMDNPPLPNCPFCNQCSSVGRKGPELYRCHTCGQSFSANFKSISSGTKCDAVTWMKVLQCLLNFAGISKTCDYCDIAPNTYYQLRNRLFYAMQVVLEEVKLYGVVEVDNTFVRASYKGANLEESPFDEDSLFFDSTFKPRHARDRGGAYAYDEKNANHLCIFTAIDDRGHVLVRFAGIGTTNYLALKNYVPEDKFLSSVPGRDPFRKLLKEQRNKPQTTTGQTTIMVADKEGAIEKYARQAGLEFESHVYRRKGVQMKLSAEAHNIQRVNALHRRLKEFLRNCHHVSAKYLPGYLVLFEFLENTGASQEAIVRVFQVLARPHCDKSAAFFDDMYTVPNYLREWLISDSPLKKHPSAKLLGYYLYDHIKHPEEYSEEERIVMADIEKETGYTAKTIRKHYRELTDAGYRDLILEHFNKKAKKSEKRERKPRVKAPRPTITPVVLALYDEYALNRALPHGERLALEKFLEIKNQEYGTDYKRTNILDKFKHIEEEGLRPPMPKRPTAKKTSYGRYAHPKHFILLDDFEQTYLTLRQQGETRPSAAAIYKMVGEKHGLTVSTVMEAISRARAYRKEHPEKEG